MPVYPSGGTIAQSVGSPGFGPAPAPSYTSPGSVRFNPADTAYFSYTPTLQGSRTTWTWAGWVKRSALGTLQNVFAARSSGSESTIFRLETNNNLLFYSQNSTPTATANYATVAVFRDVSAWYHVLVAIDTTQSTAANRVSIYINGVLQTLTTTTTVAQYAQLFVNAPGYVHAIGFQNAVGEYFSGYLAEVYFVDGLALTPASFTETSSTTGQLIPISTGYTGAYGTNGFYLPFSSNALAVDLGQNKKVTGQDGYWPYNTLLINTTNTNGAQNNTFLDSSTNNFTITRNGNTTQGNFSPFAFGGGTTQANGYYSGYFDGTGDYLTVANNAALDPNTDSFCMECWVYITGTTGNNQGFNGKGVAGTSGYSFYITNALLLSFIWNGTGGATITGGTLSLNTWNHVAVVRNSGVIRLYLNGVGAASSTACTTDINSTNGLFIGQARGGNPILGYMSNYRMTKGTLPSGYDATATTLPVPTAPLTAITNTSLLTCQSSQFIDNSTNAFTITTVGNSQPLPTNPFGMTAWSGYFDGTGDYLSMTSGTSLGSGDFTIGCWVYMLAAGDSEGPAICSSYNYYTSGFNGNFVARLGTGNQWRSFNGQGTQVDVNGTFTQTLNTWFYMAWVRSGSTVTVYRNGVSIGSVTDTKTFSDTTNGMVIGAARVNGSVLQNLNGYISNFRILVGTADSSVPSAPFTAISGTSLLTCQSSTFVDTSPNAFAITVNGNSYPLTLNNPFGNPINYTTRPVQAWSTYFDGNGDYISSPSGTPTYNLGTGLWTWEAWINTNSTATTQTVWQYYCTNTDVIAGVVNGSTGVVSFNVRATNRTDITTSSPSGSIKINQWHHIAMVRDSGTNITCYIDGKAFGVIALASNASFQDPTMFTGNPTIGAKTNAVTNYFAGYISNLRFVRGRAVYTGNFTPPTAPLTAIPGTMTLACQSNRVLDNSILNVAQVANGNTAISPVSPFIPTTSWTAASNGGSMYFDGTGDRLSYATNNSTLTNWYSQSTTIEAWIYPTASVTYTNNYPSVVTNAATAGNTNYWGFGINAQKLRFAYFSGSPQSVQSSADIPLNVWTHIAFVYNNSNSSIRLYINGVLDGSGTKTGTPQSDSTLGLLTGGWSGGSFAGYISNLRILNGTALYTTPFVPPVLPPTNISNTSLLLNATNAGIYDATGINNIETVGNAQVSTAVKKWGESSVSFDGSGDYLVVPPRVELYLSGSQTTATNKDFTIEGWFYTTTVALAFQNIIVRRASQTARGIIIVLATSTIIFNVGDSDNTSWNYTFTSSAGTIAANTWYHFALTRIGTTYRSFLNGALLNSATPTAFLVADDTSPIWIGQNGTEATSNPFIGYLQDIRFTVGAGRYSGAFTPPAAAFAYNVQDVGFQQWTPANISVTAGVGNDSLTDTVSDYGTDTGIGGQVRGNYCTMNPLDSSLTLSNGNLLASRTTASWSSSRTTIQGITSGKWYFECQTTSTINGTNYPMIGWAWDKQSLSSFVGQDAYGYGCSFFSGQKFNNNVNTNYGTAFAINDIMGVAFDADSGKIWFSKNGTWFASGDPVAGTNPAYSGITGFVYSPTISLYGTSTSVDVNFGQRAFSYTAPAGFKCLVSTNLPTPTIGTTSSTQASDYFDVSLWTGADTGTTRSISGLQFAPDLWWSKIRSAAYSHQLYDSVRGGGSVKSLASNDTAAAGAGNSATYGYLSSFDPTGVTFTRGSAGSGTNPDGYAYYDQLSATYVAWAWRANGTGVANTAGTISSTVSANTTSGCSIVTYTGTGANATVGHGLGVAPSMVIVKQTSGTNGWAVYHVRLTSASYYLSLNTTDAQQLAATVWNGTAPTSSVFSIGTAVGVNTSSQTYVAYCFAPISGFSAFGTYTGNASTDGPFIYTGFRPAYVLIKRSSAVESWCLMDYKREGYNVDNDPLFPNLANAEGTQDFLDLLSNGFKLRSTDTGVNGSGTYIYAAFAEFPFKYSRAR